MITWIYQISFGVSGVNLSRCSALAELGTEYGTPVKCGTTIQAPI